MWKEKLQRCTLLVDCPIQCNHVLPEAITKGHNDNQEQLFYPSSARYLHSIKI